MVPNKSPNAVKYGIDESSGLRPYFHNFIIIIPVRNSRIKTCVNVEIR